MGACNAPEAQQPEDDEEFVEMKEADIKEPSIFEDKWPAFEAKMAAAGQSAASIGQFKRSVQTILDSKDATIAESSISPVDSLSRADGIALAEDHELLAKTVVLKLNGGLGTGMGLDKAKSLLKVKNGMSFLELIVKQVVSLREQQPELKFLLMNSFATSRDTMDALRGVKGLPPANEMEILQSKVPKVATVGYDPVKWEKDETQEWCPPGHGDLYAALLGSGMLDKLIASGHKYMFVSNSDNLGATLDLKLLTYFAGQGTPFMMEVCERTDMDKKGGHLAKDAETGRLLLRESAQCAQEDEASFQDLSRHKYFNTNNLWIDLEALRDIMNKNDGTMPLPVMLNTKTVDPRDPESPQVYQLETAMGAAISVFENATALIVNRDRFAPVKTTSDLFAIMSDAYRLTPDGRIGLDAARNGIPPTVVLGSEYKFVDSFKSLLVKDIPSLIGCKSLHVEGRVVFGTKVVLKGDIVIRSAFDEERPLRTGVYEPAGSDPHVVDITHIPSFTKQWPLFKQKLKDNGSDEAGLDFFHQALRQVMYGGGEKITEADLKAFDLVQGYEFLMLKPKPELLKRTCVLRLNGTTRESKSLGLPEDSLKSLLLHSQGKTMLDVAMDHVEMLGKKNGIKIPTIYMNDFITTDETMKALKKYPGRGFEERQELMMNKFPRVHAETFGPVNTGDEDEDWCAPGSGDLFVILYGTGLLQKLIDAGIKYMFVADAANPGATVDLKLLSHFAAHDAPIMVEVVEREKGDEDCRAHMAKDIDTGMYCMRLRGQTAPEDRPHFQDIEKYPFMDISSIWLDLQAVKRTFDDNEGTIPMPIIKKEGTVVQDGVEKTVFQFKTDMCSSMETFEHRLAVRVPRSRYLPLKTASEVFAWRSDAYLLAKDSLALVPHSGIMGKVAKVTLDAKYTVPDLDTLCPHGYPSLKDCKSLVVEGEVIFDKGVIIKGNVLVKGGAPGEPRTLKKGSYGHKKNDALTTIDLTADHKSNKMAGSPSSPASPSAKSPSSPTPASP